MRKREKQIARVVACILHDPQDVESIIENAVKFMHFDAVAVDIAMNTALAFFEAAEEKVVA